MGPGRFHVAVAIIWEDDKILACMRADQADGASWRFPGGKVEEGETSQQACKRKVLEELGCRLSTTWLLDTVETDIDGTRLVMDCFVSMMIPGSQPVLREHADMRWLGREELGSVDWMDADRRIVRMLGEQWDAIFGTQHL